MPIALLRPEASNARKIGNTKVLPRRSTFQCGYGKGTVYIRRAYELVGLPC